MDPQSRFGNGQQFAPGQYQTPDYTQIGFNRFLERQPSVYLANDYLNSMVSPFLSESDQSGYLFTPFTDVNQINQQTNISGNQVQDGIVSSNNGSMNVDLINGNVNFTNGINTTTVDVNGVTTAPSQ